MIISLYDSIECWTFGVESYIVTESSEGTVLTVAGHGAVTVLWIHELLHAGGIA